MKARRSVRGSSARLLAGSFDRVITVDAHLHRTRNIEEVFPRIEADDLSAMPAIADALRAADVSNDTVVVGPDEESRPLGRRSRGKRLGSNTRWPEKPPRRSLGRDNLSPIPA